MLQFITSENSKATPANQILEAIEGGCRWIQIRLKNASDEEIKNIFTEIKEKAKETLTTVIINDRVELAKSLASEGVAGVHLGREDMPAVEAREKLGPDAIIGVTAHNFEELKVYKGIDVDYAGIGPFALTDTKSNLAPVLGLEGIGEIVLLAKDYGMELPLVAVGGVKLNDVASLLQIGANGIAVCGDIANSDDIKLQVARFIGELPMNE